jgi:hypothetical protein
MMKNYKPQITNLESDLNKKSHTKNTENVIQKEQKIHQ